MHMWEFDGLYFPEGQAEIRPLLHLCPAVQTWHVSALLSDAKVLPRHGEPTPFWQTHPSGQGLHSVAPPNAKVPGPHRVSRAPPQECPAKQRVHSVQFSGALVHAATDIMVRSFLRYLGEP